MHVHLFQGSFIRAILRRKFRVPRLYPPHRVHEQNGSLFNPSSPRRRRRDRLRTPQNSLPPQPQRNLHRTPFTFILTIPDRPRHHWPLQPQPSIPLPHVPYQKVKSIGMSWGTGLIYYRLRGKLLKGLIRMWNWMRDMQILRIQSLISRFIRALILFLMRLIIWVSTI